MYKFISACSKKDIKTINTEATLAKIHRVLKTSKTKRKRGGKELKNAESAMKDDLKHKTKEIQLIRSVLDETEEVVSYAEKKNRKELQEANVSIDFMNDLINDNPELAVYDEAEHKYMKVHTEKVGNVMKEVA